MQRRRRELLLALVAVLALLGASGGYLLYLHRLTNASPQSLSAPPPGGKLLIGGGDLSEEVYEQFVQLAGGKAARVVVIPCYEASFEDRQRLTATWLERRVASVAILHGTSRQQCDEPEFVKPLVEATGVWITGGDQSPLTATYVDTEVERQLHALLKRGGVIGGTSAGASAMSRVMIVEGLHEAIEQRGFDLLPGVVIDQHFLRRNRFQRLFGILAAHPDLIGLGVDEGTAVLIGGAGQSCRVIGGSYAVFCLPKAGPFPHIEVLSPGGWTSIESLKQDAGRSGVNSPVDTEVRETE